MILRKWLLGAVSIGLLAQSQTSFAYHTDEHELITRQAVNEINACYPGLVSEALTKVLVKSNLMEDYNIFNKELWYSHYYNPLKKLKMRRYDSAYRIGGLATDISEMDSLASSSTSNRASSRASLIRKLGHLIHHLQDATVPPHVVPVSHATADGFESFNINESFSSKRSCKELADFRSTNYLELLRDTAIQTLYAVDHIHWDVAAQTKLVSFPLFTLQGTAFWVADRDENFGSYGFLGNAFGKSYFTKDGATYYVPAVFYQDFKQKQMALAVFTTERALLGTLLNLPRLADAKESDDAGDEDSDETFVERQVRQSDFEPRDCDGEPLRASSRDSGS